MKISQYIQFFLILILALLLRTAFLDKPEGLWNDEYVSWFISSQNSFSLFVKELLKNCHLPFYYLYLKAWLFVFPDTDLSLRFSSVTAGVLTVISMFYLGKEFKNERLGFYCSFFAAINSFLIYFSQEVRLYSILALFSSLLVLFWLKSAKDFSRKNFLFYLLFASLITFTHTIGFVFVVFMTLTLLIYLYKNNKITLKKSILCFSPFVFVFCAALPLLYKIMFSDTLSQFWSNFNFSKLLFTLNDYFSPCLYNILNTPANFFDLLFKSGYKSIYFIIFSILPLLISTGCIIKSIIENDKKLNWLICVSGLYFLTLVIASYTGKIVFITKYSMEIFPVILLAFAFGIYSITNPAIKRTLLGTLVCINLLFFTFSNNAPFKLQRSEGNKIPVVLLQHANITNDDTIVFTYYDSSKFFRYKDFSSFKKQEITKYTYPSFIFKNFDDTKPIKRDLSNKYRDIFLNNDTSVLSQRLYDNILSQTKRNQKVAFIFLDSVSFLTENEIKKIASDEKEYKSTPFVFLVFSFIKNNIVSIVSGQGFVPDKYYESGDWTMISFVKKQNF